MSGIWNAILAGAGAGLLLALLIGGPVFLALIKISIDKGFVPGLFFAIGVIVSDSSYFTISYLGISQLSNTHLVEELLGTFGGAFLIGFGLSLIIKKEKQKDINAAIVQGSVLKSMVSGFIINTLNPAAFLFWIATVSTVTVQFSGNKHQILAFFIVCMSTVFGTDVLKAFLAGKVKHLVTPRFLHWLNRISGIILMGIGVEKLGAAIMNYFNINPFK